MSSQIDILIKIRTNFSSFKEIWLFTQIFFLATVLPIMLRFISLSKVMNVLTPKDLKFHKGLNLERSKDKIVKFTDYVLSHNFWIYKPTCLKRSLILYHFLRRLGINVYVCFGVRYSESVPDKGIEKNLEGHAWLLYKGNIYLEKKVDITRTYRITYSFPDDRALIGEKQLNKDFASSL
jgi:hypothetical protein